MPQPELLVVNLSQNPDATLLITYLMQDWDVRVLHEHDSVHPDEGGKEWVLIRWLGQAISKRGVAECRSRFS